ncbi:MAG: type III pantothenate kinase [Gammaproteobacteria bacterium]|nr:type III pantothenate kinase [Gammaproteobacteria bacterium]MCF6230884.1 type III pantothenate kinase [Gammaproteobacteria bacterium]
MLLVDIGNSRIKWAVINGDEFTSMGEAEYVSKELESQLDAMLYSVEKQMIIAVSSVASPRVVKMFSCWAEARWQSEVLVVKTAKQQGKLLNGYVNPERLGVDRWLAMIAATDEGRLGVPACVIDCGSAITIDVVGGDGQHLGGLITPGLSLMRNALVKGTRGIRLKDELPAEVSLLARDTEGAVMGGTLYTAVSMLDRVCSDIVVGTGRDTRFFITGGDAPTLIPLLDKTFEYDANLVLNGLLCVSRQMSEV